VRARTRVVDVGRRRPYALLDMKKVKVVRTRGRTRLSSKNQATIPVAAMKQAGLRIGDELQVEAAGPGRLVLSRTSDRVTRHAGRLTGVYGKRYLKDLRREWR
jgi:bifunctional DNA-binding transcriptional regulator/antitoxin component of YhaV-PrlF toxin-antitoxin module